MMGRSCVRGPQKCPLCRVLMPSAPLRCRFLGSALSRRRAVCSFEVCRQLLPSYAQLSRWLYCSFRACSGEEGTSCGALLPAPDARKGGKIHREDDGRDEPACREQNRGAPLNGISCKNRLTTTRSCRLSSSLPSSIYCEYS